MKKLSEKFEHPSGIKFKVWYKERPIGKIRKDVRVDSSRQKGTFTFNVSSPETLKKVGKVLQEIGEFTEGL